MIKAGQIDAPLAEIPPQLVGADWDGAVLTLTLDRPVTPDWLTALRNMSGYTSVMGKDPSAFSFNAKLATIRAVEHQVQAIVENFKAWLPRATTIFRCSGRPGVPTGADCGQETKVAAAAQPSMA